MSAADSAPAPEKRTADTIIYPKASADPAKSAVGRSDDSGRSSLILVVALLLAGAGGWMLFQRRKAGILGGRAARKLQIDETRPLGNRQYLVVADYEGKKFLLGVTPGRIEMLTPLDTKAPQQPQAEEKS